MELKLNCLRCQGYMEEGFLLDRSHINAQGIHYAGEWVQGPARKSPWFKGSVTVPAVTREIVTYRCTACGYLESYAE